MENGTSQGSIVSPVLISVMINAVFSSVDRPIGVVLFADDGVTWKRGRNVDSEAIRKVEAWALEWGFRFSVAKKRQLFFSLKGKSRTSLTLNFMEKS